MKQPWWGWTIAVTVPLLILASGPMSKWQEQKQAVAATMYSMDPLVKERGMSIYAYVKNVYSTPCGVAGALYVEVNETECFLVTSGIAEVPAGTLPDVGDVIPWEGWIEIETDPVVNLDPTKRYEVLFDEVDNISVFYTTGETGDGYVNDGVPPSGWPDPIGQGASNRRYSVYAIDAEGRSVGWFATGDTEEAMLGSRHFRGSGLRYPVYLPDIWARAYLCDGTPVAGVKIHANGHQTVTDSSGYAIFYYLPAGSYNVWADWDPTGIVVIAVPPGGGAGFHSLEGCPTPPPDPDPPEPPSPPCKWPYDENDGQCVLPPLPTTSPPWLRTERHGWQLLRPQVGD